MFLYGAWCDRLRSISTHVTTASQAKSVRQEETPLEARTTPQRILSPMNPALPGLTKRYEPVFTRQAVVKYHFVWFRINSTATILAPSLICGRRYPFESPGALG
jgi:hypothetical protein